MSRPPGCDADALFVVASEVVLRLRGAGHVELVLGGQKCEAGIRVLGVLEKFARPTSMRQFADKVQVAGIEEFVEATSLVARLREEGFLVDASGVAMRRAVGFDSPAIHVAMLDDLTRARAFVQAIERTVRPGDVVVDVGTGTGVLAVAAARAGAKRVYAIEEGGVADAANQVFAANGVADRVTLVRGRSTTVELPERADVLVSEILGSDPLAEDIVSVFRDARRRWLRPDARLIPQSLDVLLLPVDLPDGYLSTRTFTGENVARWRAGLGVNFDPLVDFAARIANLGHIKPQEAREWNAVGEPLLVARIDLARAEAPHRIRRSSSSRRHRPGPLALSCISKQTCRRGFGCRRRPLPPVKTPIGLVPCRGRRIPIAAKEKLYGSSSL